VGYSIFEGTMADMTFPEIESAAAHSAVVLIPIAVIKAYGPHLCLGTDAYILGIRQHVMLKRCNSQSAGLSRRSRV
jgi:creatinine amidohydrolase/Fe(II)-dependent formamide hydrolase-like protein